MSELKLVLGEGPVPARMMLIGEAPGANEVAQGRPFVGAAGKQLNVLLGMAAINRDEIYITNMVKFRISKINPLTGREVNRPVKKSELIEGRVALLREIARVNPKMICTLGNSALQGLTGEFELMIGDVHGSVIAREIDGLPRNIFPLYHPASIIYKRELQHVYQADLLTLAQVMRGMD